MACRSRFVGSASAPTVGAGTLGRTSVLYWLLKWVFLGPLLRVVFRPRVEGLANVPATGPVILRAITSPSPTRSSCR